MNTDPFYATEIEGANQVEEMKISGRQYLDFVANNDTSNNGEYYALRKALSTEIRKANSIINKVLMEATNMIEKNRENFPHVNDAELARRRRIVDEMNTIIKDVQASSDSSSVRKKIENDRRKAEGKGVSNSDPIINFCPAHEIEVQEQRILKQDRKLKELGRAVDGLGDRAKCINTEVKAQGRMLDVLGKSMDDAGDMMNAAMASLSKLHKKL